MPGLDKPGPQGQGEATGRGLGKCEDTETQANGRGLGPCGQGLGRRPAGQGRGMGRGLGRQAAQQEEEK